MELTPYQWLCDILNKKSCEMQADSYGTYLSIKLTIIEETDIILRARAKTFEEAVFELYNKYKQLDKK